MSASELSVAIQDRQLSCLEVMAAYLDRVERYNPMYNAIVAIRERDILIEEAKAADKELAEGKYRGWMHGLPHAVKDLSDVKGIVSSRGSPIFSKYLAKSDSILASRIRDAGAIFIGKTNVPEFGLGSQTYNPVYGTTLNAYNPSLCAGGSSGGAATGLATAMLPVADGSDMMGSLRNPAAYNNVIGFRPSQGRVPSAGGDLFFQQLGYEGPMGKTVEDCFRLFTTVSGYDSRAPLSMRDKVGRYEQRQAFDLQNKQPLKLGYLRDFSGYLPTEEGILTMCENALENISSANVVVENTEVNFDMARLWQTWLTLRHWTISGLAAPLYKNLEMRKKLKSEAVWEIEGGLALSGSDISEAIKARSDWYRVIHRLFEHYDFLVLPSAQVFPFSSKILWPKKIGGTTMDTYHRWMEVSIAGTLSGCPIINLPVGFDVAGRPMGMQVIGPYGADVNVLEFASAYEAVTSFLQAKPTLQ